MNIDTLLFPLVDARQIPLHFVDGRLSGHKERSLKIGPWDVKLQPLVESDFVGLRDAAVFVKIKKSLWFYLYTSMAAGNLTYLLVFDGRSAGIKTQEIKKFSTGDLRKTLDKLRAHVSVCFKFEQEDQWRTCDFEEIDSLGKGAAQ